MLDMVDESNKTKTSRTHYIATDLRDHFSFFATCFSPFSSTKNAHISNVAV